MRKRITAPASYRLHKGNVVETKEHSFWVSQERYDYLRSLFGFDKPIRFRKTVIDMSGYNRQRQSNSLFLKHFNQ